MIQLTDILQILIGGLLQGGIYGLAALGLSLILGVIGVLNIAHGEFVMLGGLATWVLWEYVWTPLGVSSLGRLLGTLLVLFAFFLIAGFAFERVLVRPILAKPYVELLLASILVTFGPALMIEDLTTYIWQTYLGSYTKSVSLDLPPIIIGDVGISAVRIIFLGIVVAVTLALYLYMKRSFVGMAMRAVTQNKEAARIMGVNVERISMFTFGLGTALAAIAGVLLISIKVITSSIGLPLTVTLLTIIVLGGIGNMTGPLVGGLVVGLAEVATSYLIGAYWAPAVALVLLIGILIVKPTGIMGPS